MSSSGMDAKVFKTVNKFFSRYPLRSYDNGQIMVHPGDQPPGIFYMVSGLVREFDITRQGNEVVVNVFKPPAFFPMNWAINNTPNEYFFAAAGNVKCRLAPAEDAVRFVKTNPDVVFNLLSRLYSGTDGILRRMAYLMGGSAKSRLIYEIVIAGRRFGKPSGDSVLIELHEDELAARAGLSRETVSRELKNMKNSRLIEVSRQGVMIKDLAYLETELDDSL